MVSSGQRRSVSAVSERSWSEPARASARSMRLVASAVMLCILGDGLSRKRQDFVALQNVAHAVEQVVQRRQVGMAQLAEYFRDDAKVRRRKPFDEPQPGWR